MRPPDPVRFHAAPACSLSRKATPDARHRFGKPEADIRKTTDALGHGRTDDGVMEATGILHPQGLQPRRAASKRVLVLVNGATTRTVDTPELNAVIKILREAGDVHVETTETLDAFRAAWNASAADRVVLVGGDGTVHAAANVVGAQRELALIPNGSANNVARSLGIPLDLRAAAELAAHGRAYPLDLIEARTENRSYLVVEAVSVGFLAQARSRYHASSSGHVLAATLAGVEALAKFHPFAVHVAGPSADKSITLSQLFVANLPLYAFGLQVAPYADPSDGLLDFVGFDGRGRRDVLNMLAALRRGRHVGREGVHLWRAKRTRLLTNGSTPIVADSTNLGFGPVVLRAAPAALRLVRPR